jgi:hypothetical protein
VPVRGAGGVAAGSGSQSGLCAGRQQRVDLGAPVSNWSLHKARLKSAFSADSHVREDTDSRFWIESHDGVRSQHYVAVTDGTAACAGMVEISTLLPNADDTITAIVESIGMATAWSADVK